MKTILKIRKKGKSKRSRCKGRTTETFNNKLSKLQSLYKHLVKISQASQVIYLALSEKDRKPKNKVFFFEKYPVFDKFLAVNKLRQIVANESKTVKAVSKPNKAKIWSNK